MRAARLGPAFALSIVVVLMWSPSVARTVDPAAPSDPARGSIAVHLGNRTSPVYWGLNTTSIGGVGISFALRANVTLPNGTLEVGHAFPGDVGLESTGAAVLTVRGLGVNSTLDFPALGSSQLVPIPGWNYSVLGYGLQVYAQINSSIAGSCETIPVGVGCAENFTWATTAEFPLSLEVPTGANSSNVELRLADLGLAFTLTISARGEVGPLGNESINIGSPVSLPDLPGSPANVSTELPVVEEPTIEAFNTSVSPVPANRSYELTLVARGGIAPLTYSYGGLPPGCASSNTSVVDCSGTPAGAYAVQVTLTDAIGSSAFGALRFSVLNLSAPPSAASGSDGNGAGTPSLTWWILAVIAGAASASLITFWWMRRPPRG